MITAIYWARRAWLALDDPDNHRLHFAILGVALLAFALVGLVAAVTGSGVAAVVGGCGVALSLAAGADRLRIMRRPADQKQLTG